MSMVADRSPTAESTVTISEHLPGCAPAAETRQTLDLALPSNYVAASLAFMHGAAAEHRSYLGRPSIVREARLIRRPLP